MISLFVSLLLFYWLTGLTVTALVVTMSEEKPDFSIYGWKRKVLLVLMICVLAPFVWPLDWHERVKNGVY